MFVILFAAFIISLPADAAVTYTQVNKTTIKDSDGTTFTYVFDGDGLDYDGNNVTDTTGQSTPTPIFKGPYTGLDRYYINDSYLCHWWKRLYLFPVKECNRINITDPNAPPPTPPYTYQAEPQSIISPSPEKKVFLPNRVYSTSQEDLPDTWKSNDGWVIQLLMFPQYGGPNGAANGGYLIDNNGVNTGGIIISGLPTNITPVAVPATISGTIYWAEAKPGNEVTGNPQYIDMTSTALYNAITIKSDNNGYYTYSANLAAGTYSLSILVDITTFSDATKNWIRSLVGIPETQTMISGATNIELDSSGKIIKGDGNIVIEKITVSTVNTAIEDAVKAVLGWINEGIKTVAGWVQEILNYGNDPVSNMGIQNAWVQVRNLTLGLLTLALLIIAFANVLSLDLDKYGIDKMIPRLVIGIVMSYFSFLIARFLLELSSAFQSQLMSGITSAGLSMGGIDFTSGTTFTSGGLTIGAMVLAILIGVAVILILLFLCFVLIIRIVVLWLLIVVSPLAFIMNVMPFTEFLYSMWWQRWWKWLFIGPSAAFFLWVGNIIVSSYPKPFSGGDINSLIQLLMAGSAIALAAIVPMQMGGDIIGAVSKGLQHLPGISHARDWWAQSQKSRAERGARRITRARAAIGRIPIARGLLTGMDRNQQRETVNGIIAERRKAMENMGDAEVARRMNRSMFGSVNQRAYAMELAARGRTPDDQRSMTTMAYYARNSRAINAELQKNQPEIFAGFVNRGNNAFDVDATRGVQRVLNGQYHPEQMRFMVNNIARFGPMINRLLADDAKIQRVIQNGDERSVAVIGEAHIRSGGAAPAAGTALATAVAAANDWATRNGGTRVFT